MISGNNSKSRRALNFALSFFLTAVFLYIAFFDVNFNQVLEIVSHSSVFFIIYFLIVQLISHFLRALRWKYIIHSVKKDTSVMNLFGAVMVGYGVNCVLPRVGEITRAVLIGKWEGLSKTSLFGTVIVERVIDVIFFALTIIISAFIYSKNLYTTFPWLKTSLYITFFLLFGAILFFILSIRYKERFYGFILRFISRISIKLSNKASVILELLAEGFGSLKGVKNYTMTILLSVIIMLLYAYASYLGFFIIGMQGIKPVTFEMGWVLNSISSIGVAIPTPGGTGSYHTLAKSALVLLYGFSEEISLAYAFITHIISYFLFIISALVLFFILNKQHLNLIKVVETDLKEV